MEFLVMFGSTLWLIYPQECEFFLPFSVISESFGGWIFLSAGLVPEFDLWFEGPNLVWWFLLLKPTSPPWSFRGIQWKCWQDGNKCPCGRCQLCHNLQICLLSCSKSLVFSQLWFLHLPTSLQVFCWCSRKVSEIKLHQSKFCHEKQQNFGLLRVRF